MAADELFEGNRPERVVCNECGSEYRLETSQMAALCPECAHWLYGYPNCDHLFQSGRCVRCGWDGSRSRFVRSLIREGEGK